MRILIFALIAANLLLAAWAQGLFGHPASVEAARLAQQIAPEKIRLVSRDEPPVAAIKPKIPEKGGSKASAEDGKLVLIADKPEGLKEGAATTPQRSGAESDKPETGDPSPVAPGRKEIMACLMYRNLLTRQVDSLENLVTTRFSGMRLERGAVSSQERFWVFIPPLPNQANVEQAVRALRQMGITDYFVVQDGSENNLAISLGVFSSREGAQAFHATMFNRGVHSVQMGERNRAVASVKIHGSSREMNALRMALSRNLSIHNPVSCS